MSEILQCLSRPTRRKSRAQTECLIDTRTTLSTPFFGLEVDSRWMDQTYELLDLPFFAYIIIARAD